MAATVLYMMTPCGYTDRRPVKLPPIDRRALMQNAHRIAKQVLVHHGNDYRSALAYGLKGAWMQVKVAREIRSLALQVGAPKEPFTAKQLEDSRRATRRVGSSLKGA